MAPTPEGCGESTGDRPQEGLVANGLCNSVSTVKYQICKMAAVGVNGVPAGKKKSQNAEGGPGPPCRDVASPQPQMQPSMGLPCGGWSPGVPGSCRW